MASNKSLQTLILLLLASFFPQTLSLNPDGTLLLAFRYAILSDPLSLLQNWHYSDPTPCSWTGVTCEPDRSRVTRLDLHNGQLLGSVAPEIGLLDQLQYLDLSGNLFNGTLPPTLFNASKIQTLSVAHNAFSGEVPASFAGMTSLRYLNFSGNALSGAMPRGLGSGEILDLSSNLFIGSVPSDIGGASLRYLNLSTNKLSGGLSPDLGKLWPENATVDLSSNNLTGQIPDAKALVGQKVDAFAGNSDLCGKPLKDQCMIPSSLSAQPKVSGPISPAIAVIPRTVESDNTSSTSSATPLGGENHTGLRPATIVGITVADLAGIGLLGLLLMYLYRWRKSKAEETMPPPAKYETYGGGATKDSNNNNNNNNHQVSMHFSATPSPAATTGCCCIKGADKGAATMTDGRSSSGSDSNEGDEDIKDQETANNSTGGGKLVMVDGETEMEMEMLMKASAYILGTSGSSIVYKAVLQDGTAFAVRRLGEFGFSGERLKRENFEGQVRAVAKLRHPNVVRTRGFYWGSTEKLVISDFISNGSLASISGYNKNGSSPCHLSLKFRMKIARGLARGLNYIHEKKLVHGNLKPSNILLNPEMEPIIGDLGINWIIHCGKGSRSGRQFGSKRTIGMGQHDVAQELSVTGSPMGNPNGPTSPYQPPELLKSIKDSPKWDVYSFGVILLELLTGKVFFDRELGQWTPGSGIEDKYWALRMADVAIRADVQGREEAMVGVFKLGFQCASMVPQKRPSMKEAMQFPIDINLVQTANKWIV
ncbi:hypothetical protein V2J09_018365 [Rumex salicifolius]